jgi:hypothetical protein
MMNSWRKMIAEEARGLDWRGEPKRHAADDLAEFSSTLSDAELDQEFDDGYGAAQGKPFTAWSKTRVYFPVVYDGAESVGSVPRDPCDEAVEHFGGQ